MEGETKTRTLEEIVFRTIQLQKTVKYPMTPNQIDIKSPMKGQFI